MTIPQLPCNNCFHKNPTARQDEQRLNKCIKTNLKIFVIGIMI